VERRLWSTEKVEENRSRALEENHANKKDETWFPYSKKKTTSRSHRSWSVPFQKKKKETNSIKVESPQIIVKMGRWENR